jgi:hypothetical protein|tara:strand:- start:1138 stop:1257 length:120 start_codon:yes stop_codon:yes gene_type:complete
MTISRTNMRNQVTKNGKKKRIVTKETKGNLTITRIRYGD